MDVFYQEVKQLQDSSGAEGQRLEAVILPCFCDLAIITFLTLLCAPHLPFTEPFGWQLVMSPRQGLLCCMQLIRATITHQPGVCSAHGTAARDVTAF